jgi:hypothetical protein
MTLPVNYNSIPANERWKIRNEYVRVQNGRCSHCDTPLEGPPPKEITKLWINQQLFPENFFKYPVHLHHCHDSGLTLGAVHCVCNAVLWQYHGE